MDKKEWSGKSPLKRLERLFQSGPLYFVTTCTFDRRPLLNSNEAHFAFAKFCENGLERGAFAGRYMLMPDHLHLFVTFDDRLISLSAWMKSLKNTLSSHWRQAGIDSPHWQKGFFDHILRSSESYAQKWAYVQQNPVRAGLVSDADLWPFQGEIARLEYR